MFSLLDLIIAVVVETVRSGVRLQTSVAERLLQRCMSLRPLGRRESLEWDCVSGGAGQTGIG